MRIMYICPTCNIYSNTLYSIHWHHPREYFFYGILTRCATIPGKINAPRHARKLQPSRRSSPLTIHEYESSTSLEVSSTDRVRVFESPGTRFEKIVFESDFTNKKVIFSSLSDIFLDSFQTPQTRESVESTKKWLEYESFEYESRLDPSLMVGGLPQANASKPLHKLSCTLRRNYFPKRKQISMLSLKRVFWGKFM